RWLLKGRIEVKEEDLRVVREGGGSAWLSIRDAKVVMKDEDEVEVKECRVPNLFESRFEEVLEELSKLEAESLPQQSSHGRLEKYNRELYKPSKALEKTTTDSTIFATSQ